jgi:hypothetical protein
MTSPTGEPARRPLPARVEADLLVTKSAQIGVRKIELHRAGVLRGPHWDPRDALAVLTFLAWLPRWKNRWRVELIVDGDEGSRVVRRCTVDRLNIAARVGVEWLFESASVG